MQVDRRRVFAASVLGFAAACGGTTEVITPPPPPPADFVVEFQADDADAATAQSLGWTGGVPEVEVTIRPADTTSGGPQAFRSDGQGKLTLSGIPPGDYLLDAARWFTAAEQSRLAPSDDALGLITKRPLVVTVSGRATVPLFGSRKSGLVISEWAYNQKGDYDYNGFLEISNNGDTTAYLDGLVVGEGFWNSFDFPSTPCSISEPFRNDPAGIWTAEFGRFPGRGRDYPVPPGAAIVVATDAIDHRPLISDGLDLSLADFEVLGPADVDNPSVPNLTDLSVVSVATHGFDFGPPIAVPFLAKPVDASSLVRRRAEGSTREWARIPEERIVDVLVIGNYAPDVLTQCPPLVHPRFDRQESRVRTANEPDEFRHSVSRRRVPSGLAAGRLLRSRSSYADLIRSDRTPGVVP